MNITWQEMSASLGNSHVSIRLQQILAQAPPPQVIDPTQPGQAFESGVDYLERLTAQIVAFLPSVLAALAILLVGLLIAAIASAIVRGILNRTDIDNRIAAGLTGHTDSTELPQVENVISSIVFWVIVLLTIVAVLQALNLQAVSQPLNTFLNQLIGFIPRLIGAAIILAIAWVVATIVKLIATRSLRVLRLDEQLNQQTNVDTPPNQNQLSLSDTIGNALYWFIFLLFLLPILNTLELNQALLPVQTLITQIISILPNILAAVLIAFTGWLLATVVRRIVTNLLASAGIDRLGTRFGLQQRTTGQSLSAIIGTIVYVLILIPVAIAALNALRIDAISVPAVAMLQQILNALPAIFTAVFVLIAAYFLGRFVGDLVTNILSSLGFDNIFSILGLPQTRVRRTTPPPVDVPRDYSTPPDAVAAATTSRTPSEIVGIVVLVGIMLFATVAAVDILNIPALTSLVSGIVVIFGRILAGLAVFAVGLFLANLAYNIITSSGDRQAQILGQIARIAIIALVSAMALQQIGVASNIVNLAFGLLLGAIAVATALAFGLGAREIAGEQVRELLASFKSKRNQPPRS
ncbi:mechanosensitive ion channel [Nostocaceae cyanobacterium CENA369]|uniref:Mechanosensitive ion channel n=1 Tax=Dendronalium phyllosphericum CENA369 TaxID=1725256 RepID=A0A8J7I2U1_9NOST|nr:mechanosensitive ion channel [Dendronalium phyllosphericum]MBH8572390.1 mechanosensitive ion channel [Dendronalium phyllosphericum CENA369]